MLSGPVETLQSFLDGSAEGILSTNRDGTITVANRALHAMFGFEPGELVGQPVERLVSEGVRAMHAAMRASFWNAPRDRPMGQGLDLLGRRKDGTTFPIEVGLTRVVTPPPDGRVLAFVTDISVRKRTEDQLHRDHVTLQVQTTRLQHRAEQLRRLAYDLTRAEQRAREELARVVQDSLQPVLIRTRARIDQLTALVARGAVDEAGRTLAAARDDLDRVIEAARALGADMMPAHVRDASFADAVTWLATRMEEKYGLRVDVTGDARVAQDRKDLRALAFESIRELLLNVVTHARVTRAAVDLATVPGRQVRITVSDEGVGFDLRHLERDEQGDAGLGLFRVRERVSLLGGRFELMTAPGHGTRVVLHVPNEAPAAEPPSGPLRILIADDHPLVRDGLHQLFADHPQLRVVGDAQDGEQAVTLARELRPDVIVMDVSMPRMDGVEATRRIHEELPGIRILGLSTHAKPGESHAIEEAGASGYFTKGDDAYRLLDHLLALSESPASSS